MTIIIPGRVRSLASILILVTVHQVTAQGVADSTAIAAKDRARDSSYALLLPIPFIGSIDRSPSMIVTDSTKDFSDYIYAGDLLSNVPGFFPFDLGSPGQLHGMTINGLDQRAIAFMSDGVPLNEPMTGTFNPYLYPVEQMDRIEVITGTSAFYYGLNSNAAAINFVSKSRKAIHPYTRIRYTESTYGHGLIDGSFSQDIIRGFNLSLGAFHHTYAGRFQNSNYDDWNGRVKLRYNVNNKLDLFASGIYNTTNLGLNGGVDVTKTPSDALYDRLTSTMVNTDSYEKVHRYDAQLGTAAELFSDSTEITTLTLYHSTKFREYRDEENRDPPNGRYVKEDTRSQWFGAKLNQHVEIGTTLIDFGAQTERRGVIASELFPQHLRNLTSVFGKVEFRPWASVSATARTRFDNYLGDTYNSSGVNATLKFSDHVNLSGGYSNSYRFQTFQELHVPDSMTAIENSGFAHRESHEFFELGLFISFLPDAFLKISFNHQSISGYNIIVPASQYAPGFYLPSLAPISISNVSLLTDVRAGSFQFEATANYLASERSYGYDVIPPDWSASGGLYFREKIVGGHLDLKTGIKGRLFTPMPAVEYNPQIQLYYRDSAPGIQGAGALDFVLIAHLGDAYIHLIWENLSDAKYVTTTFYPMDERVIRFGLTWEFTN